MQVALLHQMFLEPRLDALAKERSIGQHNRRAAVGFKDAHDEREKEVGGLAGLEVPREVAFDAVFFLAAEGRIGEHDVDAVRLRIADVGPGEGVVAADEAGVLNAVEQHVGDAEHVGKLLFLDSLEGLLHGQLVFDALNVALAHVADGAGEKAAGAAGGIEQAFAGMGIDAVDHEGCDRARRVVLARVAGALQVVQNLFIDVAEVLALGQVVEVDLIDLVDYLAQELAGLHVVVGVLKDAANDAPAIALLAGDGQFLEPGKELVVDEAEQLVACDAFGVSGPGAPSEFGWDGRTVFLVHQFELLILVVDDLEKKHPAELGDALGVAIDAGVLAHDVLDGLDCVANRHGLSDLLIESGLKFVDGEDEIRARAEWTDELDGRAHGIERR